MGAASLVVRGIVFLIGVPFLLIGLFFLLLSGAAVWDDYQDTQGVASTEGTIESTALEEATTTDAGVTETVYYPRVNYTYTVEGERYEGRRVFAPGDRRSRTELPGKEYEDVTGAQEIVREYRAGETVTVHYYEGNPDDPFLKRPTMGWGGVVAALFFGGIPIAIGVALSGGALLFGRIRARFSSDDDHEATSDATEAVHDDLDQDEEDDGWSDDGDRGGGGWGGFDGGGGDGGGGGGE